MKSLFIEKEISYNGEQLKSLFAYMNHQIQGDSIVAWCGPCHIPFSRMIDGEDVLAQSKISSDLMVHFIVEIFHQGIFTAVSFQRLISSIVKDTFCEYLQKQNISVANVTRRGDDIYVDFKKLSISIASTSTLSSMIHFAVNITNEGTPVSTCALMDYKIDPKEFANKVLEQVQKEWIDIAQATVKVRPLGSY